MTIFVEPRNPVLPNRFNHQSIIVLPMARGIAQPCFHSVRVVGSAVQKDLSPNVRSAFIDDDDHFRSLDHRPRIRSRAHTRHSRRKAARFRIVFGNVGFVFLIELQGPRSHFRFAAHRSQINILPNRIRRPISAEIDLAIGQCEAQVPWEVEDREELARAPPSLPLLQPAGAAPLAPNL